MAESVGTLHGNQRNLIEGLRQHDIQSAVIMRALFTQNNRIAEFLNKNHGAEIPLLNKERVDAMFQEFGMLERHPQFRKVLGSWYFDQDFTLPPVKVPEPAPKEKQDGHNEEFVFGGDLKKDGAPKDAAPAEEPATPAPA